MSQVSQNQRRFLQDKHGGKRACGCELNSVGPCEGKERRKALAVCLVGSGVGRIQLPPAPRGENGAGSCPAGGCSAPRSARVAAPAVPARRTDPAGDGGEGNGGTCAQVKDLGSRRKVFSNVKRKENKEMSRQEDNIEGEEVARLGNGNGANWGAQKRNS